MILFCLRILTILILSGVLFLTGGCHSNRLISQTPQESKLVLATPSDPSTFNYPLRRSPYNIFAFIYEALVTENGLTGKIEPGIAESWTVSKNQQQITLTLRPGLKWSDGTPLTTDDVMFTFQDVYLNPKIPTVYRDFLRIGTTNDFPLIRKLDNRRVEFILPQPYVPFLRGLTKLLILPAHILQDSVQSVDSSGKPKFLTTWGTNTQPQNIVGNGPYRLVSYQPAQRIILQRNPYYWQSDSEGNSLPYIDKIILQIISSTDNQLIRFRSGDLDSYSITSEAFELLKREEKRGKYTVYNRGPETGFRFVTFNLNQGRNPQGKPFIDPIKSRWFNSLGFRQAVAYAIDRETLKNNLYRGLGEVQHSPLAVQSPYYLSPEEGLKVYNYNPEKAKTILLDAGFQYNLKQELLDWDGNRVQFTILVKSEEQSRIKTAVQVKQDLSKIGIKSDLQVLSFNTVLRKLLSRRDWECYVGAFGTPGAEVEPNFLSLFWSSQGSFHQFNYGPQPGQPAIEGWKVSDWEQEIDQLFTAAAAEFDQAKRTEIYGKFQQIVAENLPIFCLVNPLRFSAVRDRIENIKVSPFTGTFWNLQELKISEKS